VIAPASTVDVTVCEVGPVTACAAGAAPTASAMAAPAAMTVTANLRTTAREGRCPGVVESGWTRNRVEDTLM
jgi:hypothetical protein